MILTIFLFLLFICLSASFSSSETALFSLSRTTLNRWKYKGNFLQRRVVSFMLAHSAVLITILLGNTFVNVYLTIFGEKIKTYLFIETPFLVNILAPIFITTILLFFGEIIPKAFAFKNAERVAPFYVLPLRILFILLRPLSYLLDCIIKVWIKDAVPPKVSVEELSTFVKIAAEEKIFNVNEVNILKNIFKLRNLSVTNCLTPRKKLITISLEASYSEISSLISRYRHSRLPIINEQSDELYGILVVKRFKMLPYSLQSKWASLAIESPYFIPEQSTLNKAAKNLSQKRIPMAIVVDEYGGIVGLLTYQDIVERVVGEVPDEYNTISDSFIEKKEDYWVLKGLVEFRQITKQCGIRLSYEGQARTVNGYLLETLNRLPQKDDIVILDDYQFRVEKTLQSRVVIIIMSRVIS